MWTWFKNVLMCLSPFNINVFCFFFFSFLFFACMRSESQTDPKSREVVLNACRAVGSVSNTSFDIRFNPDIFSPGEQGRFIMYEL